MLGQEQEQVKVVAVLGPATGTGLPPFSWAAGEFPKPDYTPVSTYQFPALKPAWADLTNSQQCRLASILPVLLGIRHILL